jgi:hypothetical protein
MFFSLVFVFSLLAANEVTGRLLFLLLTDDEHGKMSFTSTGSMDEGSFILSLVDVSALSDGKLFPNGCGGFLLLSVTNCYN